MGLYLVLGILEVIVLIISVIQLNGVRKNRYWNIFVGVVFSSFILNLLAYFVFSSQTVDLNGALTCLIACGFVFISDVILLIVGYITKGSKLKLNRTFVLVSSLVLILNLIVIFVVPSLTFQVNFNKGERKVIEYLENKYGTGDYKVINIYEEYTDNGIINSYLTGYYYEVECSYMKDSFIVSIDNDFKYIYQDYFLPVYFSEKYDLEYSLSYSDFSNDLYYDFSDFDYYINSVVKDRYPDIDEDIDTIDIYLNYVESWSNDSGVIYSDNYYIIPSDGGKIPTLDEVIDLLVKELVR